MIPVEPTVWEVLPSTAPIAVKIKRTENGLTRKMKILLLFKILIFPLHIKFSEFTNLNETESNEILSKMFVVLTVESTRWNRSQFL